MEARVRPLLLDAVHAQADIELLRVHDLVRGDDARPQRTESVETLALVPLPVPLLQVARSDVVGHRIAEDVESASASAMSRPSRPMITASSTSQSIDVLTCGCHGMALSGPITHVAGLVKNTGYSGSVAPTTDFDSAT